MPDLIRCPVCRIPKILESRVAGVRLPIDVEQRVSRVAEKLSRRAVGAPVRVSTAMAILVKRGLTQLEPEPGPEPPSPKTA
jgi:hypothetical protein